MGPKRKFAEANSSDEDEPSLGRQVLPVANLPDNFNGEPTDGMQYLFTVRRDARLLPHVTRVANPYEIREEASMTPRVIDLAGSHPLLPSEEWRDVFLRRFKNFRKNLLQPTIRVHMPIQQKVMPDKKDRDRWWAFLSGRPASEWNTPKKSKQPRQNMNARGRYESYGNSRYGGGMRGFSGESDSPNLPYDTAEQNTVGPSSPSYEVWRVSTEGVELAQASDPSGSLPTPSTAPATPDERVSTPRGEQQDALSNPVSDASETQPEPTPSLMQHIDSRYALHLLMYFAHWINLRIEEGANSMYKITPTHARWMFGLLSRVDDHITADETSLLRVLARACISFVEEIRRHSLGSFEKPLKTSASSECSEMDDQACWMVVAAIIGVWGQKDLWIDAETMLSRLQS